MSKPEFVPLSVIVRELESGVSVNGADRPANLGESGVLKTSAVSDGRFYPSENKAIHGQELSRSKASIRKDDLLISRMNTPDLVGACGIVGQDYPHLFLPDRLWRVVLDNVERDDIRWLTHVLNSQEIRAEIKVRASGTSNSMKNISQGSLLGIKIVRPPLHEQIEIARILGAWDAALSQLSQLIAAKTQLKRALMQQLLTGARRFREFEGQAWRPAKIGELFWERNECNRPDLPLLSITSDRGVIPRDSVERKDTSNENKSAYLRIARGDIGYNTMRMWQGVSALSPLEGIISPAYTVCVPNDSIYAEFAAYLFKGLE